MRVIVSHDVDHITAWEHTRDLIIPKFVIRNFIEYELGYISGSEVWKRLKSIVQNKWQNLDELMAFDREHDVPSTFFLAVNNGKGLSYSVSDAEFWVKRILKKGFGVGLHGIGYKNLGSIKREYETFKRLSGLEEFGIRMHYLMNSNETVKFFNELEYLFDSTRYEMKNPYKIGKLWEFPLHIMDGYLLFKKSKWQNQNVDQAKELTKRTLEEAWRKNIRYFTILFHDRYFSDAYVTLKNWYVWFIEYAIHNGLTFMDFKQAIREMKSLTT